MANLPYISRLELAERRKKLRWQRRMRAFRAFWRTLVAIGLTGGAVWLMTLPGWVIRDASQINVEGNAILTPEMVRSLLSMNYPQSLWDVQPEVIANELEARGPIADATVTRQLFPPSLTIQIQERRPVAIAYSQDSSTLSPGSGGSPFGLLDATGAWMPVEDFTTLNPTLQLPTLKVVGMKAQYRTQWTSLYQDLTQHQQASSKPVAIREIDWRNPSNLILKTELGDIHIGAYSSSFRQQLMALDQMQQLPADVDRNQISYIDLKNPDAPLIQMNNTLPLNQ